MRHAALRPAGWLASIVAVGMIAASQIDRPYEEARLDAAQSMRLYDHWTAAAYSGVIAALANQRLKKASKHLHAAFEQCARRADTIPKHARCLREAEFGMRDSTSTGKMASSARLRHYQAKPSNTDKFTGTAGKTDVLPKTDQLELGKSNFLSIWSFRIDEQKLASKRRRKRFARPTIRDEYALLTPHKGTPIGGAAKLLTRLLLDAKGKSDIIPWRQSVERLRALKQRHKTDDHNGIIMKSEFGDDNSVDYGAFAKAIKSSHFPQIKQSVFYDQSSMVNKFKRLSALIRDGVAIGHRLAGGNESDVGARPIRIMSPRFFSIVPEDALAGEDGSNDSNRIIGSPTRKDHKNTTINIISPSVLSLHADGSGVEAQLSIANLMRAGGLSVNEQQDWMNFILEASGTNDEIAKLERNETTAISNNFGSTNIQSLNAERVKREFRTKDGQPLYFTKENVTKIFGHDERLRLDVYERVIKSLTEEQWLDMNSTGYSFLKPIQIADFYGPHSPYSCPRSLKRYARKSRRRLLSDVRADVRRLADAKHFGLRLRDVIQSPTILAPIIRSPAIVFSRILSPLALSPFIQSPTIVGSMILSPWIFSPLILSPHLIMPLILSPYVFSPHVLSPLVLQPNILSPGVFSPFILSPFLLTPSILSPYVFSPLILNPFVLSPVILTPTVGNPVILSPYVLSPILGSPQSLGGLFLSPYAASPVLLSPLSFFLAILSPSTLS